MNTQINNYLNSLNVNESIYIIENNDKVSNLFKSALSKFNLDKKQKQEGEEHLKEIQQTTKFKRILKVIKSSVNDDDLDQVKLGSGLKKELGPYLGKNTDVIIMVITSIVPVLLTRNKHILKFNLIASFVYILSEISPAIITKVITKNKKSLIQIQQDLRKHKNIKSIDEITDGISTIQIVIFIMTFLGLPAIIGGTGILLSSLALISITMIKFMYSTYIGVKLNSWKYQEKLLKKKGLVKESKDYTLKNYIDSTIFISSLRENLYYSVKSQQSKDFIINEATDYEIINFVVNGHFPEKREGDYSNLLDIFYISFDEEIIPIQEHNISTLGITSSILIETLFESGILNNSILLEATVNKAKLDNLEQLLKQTKKKLAAAMKDNLENDNTKTREKYTKAGVDFQDAKERYKTYKDSGFDPGDKAYSNNTNTGNNNYQSQDQGNNAFWNFMNKILTFSPGEIVKKLLSKVYGAEQLSKFAKINQPLSGALITLTGVALAALFTYASYRGYQRFLSVNAKKCSNYSFKEKTICMKKLEIKATEERIKDIQKVIKSCDLLKKKQERIDCKIALKSRIESLKKDIKNLKTGIN